MLSVQKSKTKKKCRVFRPLCIFVYSQQIFRCFSLVPQRTGTINSCVRPVGSHSPSFHGRVFDVNFLLLCATRCLSYWSIFLEKTSLQIDWSETNIRIPQFFFLFAKTFLLDSFFFPRTMCGGEICCHCFLDKNFIRETSPAQRCCPGLWEKILFHGGKPRDGPQEHIVTTLGGRWTTEVGAVSEVLSVVKGYQLVVIVSWCLVFHFCVQEHHKKKKDSIHPSILRWCF